MYSNKKINPFLLPTMRTVMSVLDPIYAVDQKNKENPLFVTKPDPWAVKVNKAGCIHRLPTHSPYGGEAEAELHVQQMKNGEFRCDICGRLIETSFSEDKLIKPIKDMIPALDALVAFGPMYKIPVDIYNRAINTKVNLLYIIKAMETFIGLVANDNANMDGSLDIGRQFYDNSVNLGPAVGGYGTSMGYMG